VVSCLVADSEIPSLRDSSIDACRCCVTDEFGILAEVLVRPTWVVEAYAVVLRHSAGPMLQPWPRGLVARLPAARAQGCHRDLVRS
jgi:hypothetical protein